MKGQKGKGCSRSLADGFWYTAKRERESQARGKQGGRSLAHISWEVPAIDSTWNYSLKKIANHGLFMRLCLFSSSYIATKRHGLVPRVVRYTLSFSGGLSESNGETESKGERARFPRQRSKCLRARLLWGPLGSIIPAPSRF